MRLAYFVHDLSDPAVGRRVRMLRAGGVEIVLFGFNRSSTAVTMVEGVEARSLGVTENGRLGRRAVSVVKEAARAGRLRRQLADCDVVMARNLEMLAIAGRARAIAAPTARLIYECLDIHRVMLGRAPIGRALRALERRLMRHCQLLIVSSPGFLNAYFGPVQRAQTPTLLVENKPLVLPGDLEGAARPVCDAPPRPPWRIGWFGVIRCRTTFEQLATLARTSGGRIEVVIRGRPAPDQFEDLAAQAASAPGVSFGGEYRADELPTLYSQLHFTWAIDYFSAGQNSDWLLPNRIYEGGMSDVVPIALAGVETGRWLARHGAGVLVTDPERELPDFFDKLTPENYAVLHRAAEAIPRSALIADFGDCRRLVDALTGNPGPSPLPGATSAETTRLRRR